MGGHFLSMEPRQSVCHPRKWGYQGAAQFRNFHAVPKNCWGITVPKNNTNRTMKRMITSTRMFKSLLLAGLLAGPMLAFNVMAQNREDIHWSPADIFIDGSGNQYAYWDDANNWAGGVVPVVYDTNQVNTFYNAAFDSATVTCLVTNNTQVTGVGQLMAGFGGGGTLVITNGAHFQAGFSFGGIWT